MPGAPHEKTACSARARRLRRSIVVGASLISLSGCARQEGAVELDWSIVDGDFEDLFPGQRYSSSCNFSKLAQLQLDADSDKPKSELAPPLSVDFSLQVRLRIYDCAESETLEVCEQRPPVRKEVFDCQHMRGTIGGLSSRDTPYLFVVDTVMTPSQGPNFVPRGTCVATPGARRRRIRAGQITNLAVYQIVVQATEDRLLEVEKCREPSPASSAGSSESSS